MSARKGRPSDAVPGARVRVAKGRRVFEGLVMPSTTGEMLVIKLDSGYDVGVGTKGAVVETLEEVQKKAGRQVPVEPGQSKGLPPLSVVYTGGTIASRVDYRTGGVHALVEPGEILQAVPELSQKVSLKVTKPLTLMSEDMGPAEWQKIAAEVARELNSGARGVIVTHGTDTLHFTSAALSFMLRGLGKPVAVVGAQRSPDRASFDGTMNLLCAANYCLGDLAEVAVVMHATSSDDYCFALRGTKARKMHASRRDAFRPINDRPLARVFPDGKMDKISDSARMRQQEDSKVIADTGFEKKVAILKAYPGSPPELVDYLVEKKYKGIVIEATALGHVPTNPLDKKMSWIPSVKAAVDKGVAVCIATQCLYGRVDPFVYTNLRLLHATGAIFCRDMLPETTLVKLGWVLAKEKALPKVRELMLENVAGEFNPRLGEDEFLN